MRWIITACVLILAGPGNSRDLSFDRQVFDFGAVGIDFSLHYDFELVNSGSSVITLDQIKVGCDCSAALPSDSLLNPGDTVRIRATLDTKNLYGRTNKSLTVFTSSPEQPEIQFFFPATVGQWIDGVKPKPLSLLFLPGQSSKKVDIFNKFFDRTEVKVVHQYDDSFDVGIDVPTAGRGEFVSLSVTPRQDLTKGTYDSNFTVHIQRSDQKEPAILTIPVKIVVY